MITENLSSYIAQQLIDIFIKEIDTKQPETSPIRWYGGKFYIADWIVSFFPKHVCYVEPFFGAGYVLFAKEPSEVEIVNDLNEDLIAFWRVLQDDKKLKVLLEKIVLTPYSRKIFDEMKDACPFSEIDKAFRLFYLSNASFSSKLVSFSTSVKRNHPEAYTNKIVRIINCAKRLRNVVIENLDAFEVIRKYDSSDTLFYLDPPYIHDTRGDKNSYEYEMTNEQHKQLVELILQCKGKVVLSGYRHPIYDELEKSGWLRFDKEVPIFTTLSKNSKRLVKTESVWVNFRANEIGRLF